MSTDSLPHKILIDDGNFLISRSNGKIIINDGKKIISIPENYIRVIHWALGINSHAYLYARDESDYELMAEESQC